MGSSEKIVYRRVSSTSEELDSEEEYERLRRGRRRGGR